MELRTRVLRYGESHPRPYLSVQSWCSSSVNVIGLKVVERWRESRGRVGVKCGEGIVN